MRARMVGTAAVVLLTTQVSAQEAVDPLAELSSLGDALADSGPEGGGSIRAKKDSARAATKRLKDPRNLQAKVERVNAGEFPMVALEVKVIRPARKGKGKDIDRNKELVVVPELKVKDGSIDMSDADTLINAGAFYLRDGDRVMIRLGEKKGDLWQAEYIERK